MITNKQKIRIEYDPLVVMCSAALAKEPGMQTLSSSFTQQFEGADGTFAPDRTLEPTIIIPDVFASAKDGSWDNGRQNGKTVADARWFVDGVSIYAAEGWQQGRDFVIDENTESSTYGQITISKNIVEGTVVRLHFEAKVVDGRTGLNIPVVSNDIVLTTIAKSPAEFTCSAPRGSIIYDIFADHLLEWDYAVANGKPTDVIAASRDEAMQSGTPYLQKFPIAVYRGDREYKGEVSFSVYKKNNGDMQLLVPGECEILSITPAQYDDYGVKTKGAVINMDIRLCGDNNAYMVVATPVTLPNVNPMRCEFSVVRNYSDFKPVTENQSSIEKASNVRLDHAVILVNGNALPYPEAQLEMTWFTSNWQGLVVEHNQGADGVIDMVKAAPGEGEDNGWLEVWIDIETRKQEGQFVDEAGAVLTNDEGKTLIS